MRLIQVTVEELLEEARHALRHKEQDEDEEESADSQRAGSAENGEAAAVQGGAFSQKDENRLQNNYGGAFKMIRECGWLNIDKIGQRLLGKKKLTSIEWFYLRMALTGECDRTTQYVCIDEVQDYTEAQLMVFARYFINAKFMLLGDEFQSIREGNVSFSRIHGMFEERGKQTAELSLQTSYRSSPEITALFAGLLPEEKKLQAQSVQRPGTLPQIRSVAGKEEWLRELREEIQRQEKEPGITAVVCADKKSMDRLQTLLGKDAPAVIGSKESIPKSGSLLITLAYAKGLEFDHVILPDADPEHYPEGELSRHRLYTAISRATQSITIFAQGEMSPLLGKR